ncbi:hypothetical protein PPYR_01563, partial [Photinus pyralis]
TTSLNYHNKVLRLKALEAIKAQLESEFKVSLNTDEIMKKINNVRTQFLQVRREHKKIHSGMGEDEVPTPTWWLHDQLQFLLPYCKKDASKSNLTNLEDVLDSQQMGLTEDTTTENSEHEEFDHNTTPRYAEEHFM